MRCYWNECASTNNDSTETSNITVTKSFKQCNGCKSATYCSPECQKCDWPTHKSYCKVVQTLVKLTDRSLPLSQRTLILDKDYFRNPEVFAIMISTKHADLADLLIEDIEVHFGTEVTKQKRSPQICWTTYLLNSLFRGESDTRVGANKFYGVQKDYFIRGSESSSFSRLGARMKLGNLSCRCS